MRRLPVPALILCCAVILAGCAAISVDVQPLKDDPLVSSVRFSSPAIERNMIEQNPERSFFVLLPPSYHSSPEKRYPVVYNLHGYTGGGELFRYRAAIRDMMASGTGAEFIIVDIEGNNKFGGAFYVNSPVTGNWDDHITKEIVPLIDRNFRTIADRQYRGISGFSMGGFGAVNLSLLHPDLFSWSFVASPGLFAPDGLSKAMKTWNKPFLDAYGAAFSPDVKGSYPFARIPLFDGSESDGSVIRNWESGFGNLEEKLAAYSRKKDRLSGMFIVYGELDSYPWIPEGCGYFLPLLEREGIPHGSATFRGGHSFGMNQLQEHYIPFFTGAFTGK